MSAPSGYLACDTIAAIATELGGAISVLRISGPRSFEVLNTMTQSDASEPRKMVRGTLYSEKKLPLDDALWVRFPQPNSYTGEDVVELHLHGGGYIAHRILEALITLGIRQALPGEFSFRAVRNGKLSLFQAQAVSDLITATNDDAVTLALEKLGGSQNEVLRQLAQELRTMAVLGEVGIDFADQDIEEVSLPHLQKKLDPIIHLLNRLEASFHRGIRLQDGVKVAFVGLPNAGKSSFFNALLGEDRSIVSEIAGTTRDVVREKLTLRGTKATVTLRLEDTAGLRTTENIVEKMGIDRTRRSAQDADLILFLVDPYSDQKDILQQWTGLSEIPGLAHKTIGIWTKSDQSSPSNDLVHLVHPFAVSKWVSTSAVTQQGLTEAVEAIVQFCEALTQRAKGEVLLTRLDHFQAVRAAREDLRRAQKAFEIDLFASDIRQALHSLGPLIGETLPDDILGKIFSDFCIGK